MVTSCRALAWYVGVVECHSCCPVHSNRSGIDGSLRGSGVKNKPPQRGESSAHSVAVSRAGFMFGLQGLKASGLEGLGSGDGSTGVPDLVQRLEVNSFQTEALGLPCRCRRLEPILGRHALSSPLERRQVLITPRSRIHRSKSLQGLFLLLPREARAKPLRPRTPICLSGMKTRRTGLVAPHPGSERSSANRKAQGKVVSKSSEEDQIEDVAFALFCLQRFVFEPKPRKLLHIWIILVVVK